MAEMEEFGAVADGAERAGGGRAEEDLGRSGVLGLWDLMHEEIYLTYTPIF